MPDSNSSGFSPLGFTIFALELKLPLTGFADQPFPIFSVLYWYKNYTSFVELIITLHPSPLTCKLLGSVFGTLLFIFDEIL